MVACAADEEADVVRLFDAAKLTVIREARRRSSVRPSSVRRYSKR
jgi:hypothetical protein